MIKMVNFMLYIFYHNKNKHISTHTKRGSYKSSSKENNDLYWVISIKKKKELCRSQSRGHFLKQQTQTSPNVTDASVSMNVLLHPPAGSPFNQAAYRDAHNSTID